MMPASAIQSYSCLIDAKQSSVAGLLVIRWLTHNTKHPIVMKMQIVALLALVSLMTSCSLYSTKPEAYVAVSYAHAAKREAIKQGKNADNQIVNGWLDNVGSNATATAEQICGKVDLSSAAIPQAVHDEITKVLGHDIAINSLIPKAAATKSGHTVAMVADNGKAVPEWLEILLVMLKEANGAVRTHQRDLLIKRLEDAKWGQPFNLPPTGRQN